MKLKDCTKSTSTCTNSAAKIDLLEWSHKSQSRVFNYQNVKEKDMLMTE